MKILGVGTDIVNIKRITAIWDKYGMRFAKHILATTELETLVNSKSPARVLAKRFAIKEAVAKALGTGFRGEVFLTNIAISHDALGKPKIDFVGQTKNFVATLGDIDLQVTVADEEKYVVAFVIITG